MVFRFYVTFWLAAVLCSSSTNGSNILGLFPFPGKSHYAPFDSLMIGLAAKGHQVTVYSPFPKAKSIANYTEVDLSKCFVSEEFDLDLMLKLTNIFTMLIMINAVSPTYEIIKSCQPLIDLLQSNDNKYDLMLTETFHTDIFLIYAYKWKIPFISYTPNVMFPWHAKHIGNPDNPSYIPNILIGYLANMNFYERLSNTHMYLITCIVQKYLAEPKQDDIARRLLGPGTPSLNEIARNTSLMFTYTHSSLNTIQPLVPAVIEISGINIRPKPSPLPKDIEKFINGSEHGVIYFCMGSLLRGSSFPEDKRKAFLYAFSKIPQRVLWKWEGDNLPGKPDNVMIAKWMPQRDILAHPNVKLFISHGGLLGTNEAVYEGVPILGIPIFGDQRTNVKSIEASGAGELLDYNDISDEVVFGKIQKLLHDPKYRENAKELSRRYRDRPMSPLDTAVYWTEYVIRHKGAHHLRSAAVDLPWYQYLLLDVIAFVLLVLVVSLLSVYYSIKFTLRFIFRKLFGKKQPTKSEKSKKKLN